MILNDPGVDNMITITIGETLGSITEWKIRVVLGKDIFRWTNLVIGDSSLCIDDLLWQKFNSPDDSPDGWRKFENKLSETYIYMLIYIALTNNKNQEFTTLSIINKFIRTISRA
jgi:hypothetical protein